MNPSEVFPLHSNLLSTPFAQSYEIIPLSTSTIALHICRGETYKEETKLFITT